MLSPDITRRLIDRTASDVRPADTARASLGVLGDREREVAVAIADGRTNADIATHLGKSEAPVKAHVTHIFVKLGLTNRTQIAVLVRDAEM